MLKLAPMFIMSSMVAFAGAAFAADTTGSPTVTPNTTNPQGLSYSDKSNTSTGTNAVMNEKDKATATMEDDKKAARKSMKKAKTHNNTTKNMDSTVQSDTSMGTTMTAPSTPMGTSSMGTTSSLPAPTVARDPGTSSGTNAAAVNSTGGKSGQ